MDSMRSLNTSLPRATKPKPTPPPDLSQTFRMAALAVTNLYKAAVADSENTHAEGYQQALDDLLGFLDKENLGVGDGEGWRIRQWVTERQDKVFTGPATSDSDEDVAEEKRARSSSPVLGRNSSLEDVHTSEPPHVEAPQRSDSAPPPIHTEPPATDVDMAPPAIFQFSSPHVHPANGANDSAGPDLSAAARRAFATPRRTSIRSSSRNLQRSAASNLLSLGNGAGQKRKLMSEFFNIDNFSDRRDGNGGGKRGRML
ncbi:uncharacterized protein BDR25DRAFT_300190 [Lindgomyces ingoldianus]|uniref:Uncharacterized protein n=1 Tax=Lindgomyces ingoldianus TaxID=673940 RepID=A0ACB6RDH8_9PLEO|nr:uncharacterized protein BDR25DRAFT_300190 [Lindgomyces ingoldianus]KAF2477167.1 hypothetical protein BDR25DRAFT_300190 [Lindgomyces ingoldianus]